MSWLPKGTVLGNLRLLETYDYIDGPRLFAARNTVGTTFLALWADDLEVSDVWLYAPVSEERLSELREGERPIREAFLHAEDGAVYRVTLAKRGDAAHAEPLRASEVPQEWLPPEDDRIELEVDGEEAAEDASIEEAEKRAAQGPEAWVRNRTMQRVVISRDHGRLPPPLDVVTDVLAHWRRLFEETVRRYSVSADMLPICAAPGSFRIDLAVGDPSAAVAAFRSLVELSGLRSRDEWAHVQEDLPVRSFRKFLAAVAEHGVSIRVTMQDANDAGEIVLEARDAARLAGQVADLGRSSLSSDQVPQADDLRRVFRVVEMVGAGREVTAERLGVVHRQVNYYRHAARVLGYLDSSNSLASAGSQILRLNSEERLKTAAMQFESCDCGGAWVAWSAGTSLLDIDAERAEEFLRKCSDLSASTAERRAKTLKSWLGVLLPNHYRNWTRADVG